MRHSQYSLFPFAFQQSKGGKLYGNFPRKFPEGEKTELLNLQKANDSATEMEWMETKLPGRNFCKAGYTSRGCPLLSEILVIAGLFDTGSCQKFKQEILVEWNLRGGGRG